MSIQRWRPDWLTRSMVGMAQSKKGAYVLYADHVAELADERWKHQQLVAKMVENSDYQLGLADAREAVAALSVRWAYPSNVVDRDDALAAIDALRVENDYHNTWGIR